MNIWTILEQFERQIPPENLIILGGILLLAAWLLKTSLGRTALNRTRVRRHAMPVWIIVPVFLIWQLPAMLITILVHPWLPPAETWQRALANNLIMGFSSVITIGAIILLGHRCFARRLKGFGLGCRRLHKDLGAASVNLLVAWPLVLALILIVTAIQQGLHGPDYQMQQHQELTFLVQYDNASLRWSIVILAVILAPIVEELVFRGILQSSIRSVINLPWLAIALSSTAFAMSHANKEHWPSLFVLGGAMGYAYEKNGSLWQAIFVHALFNGITIVGYLGSA